MQTGAASRLFQTQQERTDQLVARSVQMTLSFAGAVACLQIVSYKSDAPSDALLSICDAYSEAHRAREAFSLSASLALHCSLPSGQGVTYNMTMAEKVFVLYICII